MQSAHHSFSTLPATMRLRILSCLLLLAVSFDAAAGDLYTAINRLRAGDGNCAVAQNLPPLQPQSALERVARNLARGEQLQQSLQAAGYPAMHSSTLNIRGDGVGARADAMLAGQSACRQLQDGAMTEIGIYLDARQMWIVMAVPFAQRVNVSGPAAPFAPPVRVSGQATGHRILDLINQARATPRYCGNERFNAARPLRWNDMLAESSLRHSEDMARNNYFDHSSRDGSHSWDRVERAGYRYSSTGENIAAGQQSAEEAVAGWINSPGHCANLMNPDFVDMGAAVAVNRRSAMGLYWTQEFGTPL
jgi:uncharacterized protein YkwD